MGSGSEMMVGDFILKQEEFREEIKSLVLDPVIYG